MLLLGNVAKKIPKNIVSWYFADDTNDIITLNDDILTKKKMSQDSVITIFVQP